MTQIIWQTPVGTLGTIPEGAYYSTQLITTSDLPVTYTVISGELPRGMALSPTGQLAGVPTVQATTVSKFTVRARSAVHIADRTFTITVSGDIPPVFITAAGVIEDLLTGTFIYTPVAGSSEKLWGFQIDYSQPDVSVISLVSGSLPQGVSITDKGFLSGYVLPLNTTVWYNVFTFTLEITNGKFSSLRTYSIGVYNRASLTADNIEITSDNTFITADASPLIPPVITTRPGSVGTTKVGDYFLYQFSAFDFQNAPYQYAIVLGNQIGYDQYPYTYDEDFTTYDQGELNLPPDVILDPNSGWLYGRVLPTGVSTHTYNFGVAAFWRDDPAFIGEVVQFSLTVVDELLASVTWLTPSDLGSIDNGSTSTFQIVAIDSVNKPLFYRFPLGYYTSIPQGLTLLPSGILSGRVSFQTFCLDGGTTTFDETPANGISDPTTFDLKYQFAVEAYSTDGTISSIKTFTILVNRVYNAPYQNLFITAMPPSVDRLALSSLLSNSTVFPDSRIYRPDDPFFGVARTVTYWHCYGLTDSTLDEYVNALQLNHYDKNLVLGEIKTARALDSTGNVMYEVVYSEVVDNLVNNEGQSISKSQVLAYPPVNASIPSNSIFVFPNSLQNMRDQVIDTLGQTSNILPRWMLSTQRNGQVLGFTPAWIIAYTQPGQSGRVAYDVNKYLASVHFGLNQVDFTTDRYTVDRVLDYYYDPIINSWTPTPEITTFDTYTIPPDFIFKGYVDRGSYTSFFDIQHQTISYVNSIGGIDGDVDVSIDGKLIVFIQQQNFFDPLGAIIPGPLSDTQAWTNNYAPGGPRVIPGQYDADLNPGVTNERMGIYRVNVVAGLLELTLVDNTTYYDYVIVRGGASFNNASVYYPVAPGVNLTVVSWLTLPVIDPGATTFDQDSMQFVDPNIAYETVVSGAGDAYIMYPRPDIIPVLGS